MPENFEEQIQKAIDAAESNEFSVVISECREILNENSNDLNALILLAMALEKTQNFDEAISTYKRILVIKPDFCDIYKKLADLYYFIKSNPEETAKCYENVLKIQPNNNEAKACLSIAYLKMKQYKKGWEFFEYRTHKNAEIMNHANIVKDKPLWNGEDIANKSILVYPEAGFGDTIMFSRFLKPLSKICKRVIFEPEKTMLKLFKDSNFDIDLVDLNLKTSYPNFDMHVPLMSLPYLLNLNAEKDLNYDTYIKANEKKSEQFKSKFFLKNGINVGINWKGCTKHTTTRSIDLNFYYPLFDVKGINFYSLQKGDGIEQLEDAKQFNITNLGATFEDFSDTAAAIDNLDLVISNDTSIAHLAGAMGKKCFILLPYNQDWRWGTNLNECIWYKNIKLFRQKEAGNWNTVLEEVKDELNLIGRNK